MEIADVIIIGAGLLGCFSARNLSRYPLRVLVLEKEADVCRGISRANTGIVYTGYDTKPGSLKTKLCVQANEDFDRLCEDLSVPFRRCGSLMVSYGPNADKVLRNKYRDGTENGVRGLELLSGAEAEALEPELAHGVSLGLFSPDTGTVNPWELCIAAYENAKANGAEFRFGREVRKIRKEAADAGKMPGSEAAGRSGAGNADTGGAVEYLVETDTETFRCRALVNAAGLSSDRIRELIHTPYVRLFPTGADYILLDESEKDFIRHVIFHEGEDRKGLTLVPTVDGNLMVGPTNRDPVGLSDLRALPTSEQGFEEIRDLCRKVVPGIRLDRQIRSFGSLRPNPYYVTCRDGEWVRDEKRIKGFFLTEEEGFFSLIGIKTPGLTFSNELGKLVAEKVTEWLNIREMRRDFDPRRTPSVKTADLSTEELDRLIRQDADYGRILCHCKNVTKGEVLDAIRRGASDPEGIKRRTGCLMGNCQGSRCRTEIMELLKSERPDLHGTAVHIGRRVDTDILVIGGGAAGMAAAAEAAKAGSRVLMVEKKGTPGGVLTQCIHQGFGLGYFGTNMTGQEYLDAYLKKLRETSAEILTGTSVLEVRADRTALLQNSDGLSEVHFRGCVLATGCREKPLQSLPIQGTRPEGIYTAGEIQELINLKGKKPGNRILILGSGDIGQIMARQFVQMGKTVTAMVEQRDHLGGMERNRRECIESFHIPFLLNATVKKLIGYPLLTAAVVGFSDGRPDLEIPCDMLITAMGLIPDRDLAKKLEINGTIPNWLRICGNADQIHEIVDRVTVEGERIGRELASMEACSDANDI